MKKIILFVNLSLLTFTASGKEIQLVKNEEIFHFGNCLLGIKCERSAPASFTLRKINQYLEETKSAKETVAGDKPKFTYEVMGSKMYVEVFDRKSGNSEAFLYDTSLTLISKRTFTKEQIAKRYIKTSHSESEFDMTEYYDRNLYLIVNNKPPLDLFTEDGMLFLSCNLPGNSHMPKEEMAEGKKTIIYRLKWAADNGNYPVRFDIKWTINLPVTHIYGYRFYNCDNNVLFLYLVYDENGEMKTRYYRINEESGEIIGKVDVNLPENAIAWTSDAYYDKANDCLFIVGNYQAQKNKAEFDGFFVGLLESNDQLKVVLKPFPTLPGNSFPQMLKKDPVLVAEHFTNTGAGNYTCTCSFFYSSRAVKNGEDALYELTLASIVLLDFDRSLLSVNSRPYMFEHYSIPVSQGNGGIMTLDIVNQFTMAYSHIHPLFSDISGITEMVCKNIYERDKIADGPGVTGYYYFSTVTTAEFKKGYEIPSDGETEIRGYFRGNPGEIIVWKTTSDKSSLEIITTHPR